MLSTPALPDISDPHPSSNRVYFNWVALARIQAKHKSATDKLGGAQ